MPGVPQASFRSVPMATPGGGHCVAHLTDEDAEAGRIQVTAVLGGARTPPQAA